MESLPTQCCTAPDTASTHGLDLEAMRAYYANETGRRPQALARALEMLGIGELHGDARTRAEATMRLKNFGRQSGWFGEVATTFVVCSTPEVFGKCLAAKAAWRNEPGGVSDNVDLVVLEVETARIHYLEVKTAKDQQDNRLAEPLAKLARQLGLKRIQEYRKTSYLEWSQSILAVVLRRPDVGEQLAKALRRRGPSEAFTRVGSVVCGEGPGMSLLEDGRPDDSSQENPVHMTWIVSPTIWDATTTLFEFENLLVAAETESVRDV